MAVGVFVLGYVARYLGAAQFGVLNYAIGLTAIFASIATLGIEGIVIREMVKAPEQTNIILGTACALRFLGGIAAIILLFAAASVANQSSAAMPLIVVVSLAFLPQAFDVIDLWFQKNIHSKFTVLARGAAVLFGAAVKIALVKSKAPLLWFGASVVLDAILGAIALICVFHWRGARVRDWAVSSLMARTILRSSWPLILSGLLVAIYMRVEQVLVMNVLGSVSMGIYYASTRITEMWMFIPTYILSTIYPVMVDKRETDVVAYHRRLQQVFDLLTGIGYLVAITASCLAPVLVPLIYGPDFRSAIPVLLIQAWTAPIVFSGSVRAQYFLLENLTVYHTWSALIGIIVNVALALVLMPRIQSRGAALAALIGYFVSSYVTSLFFKQLRQCGKIQTKAFLLPFRLPGLIRTFSIKHEG